MLPALRRPPLSRTAQTFWFLLDPVGFFERRARGEGPIFEAPTLMYGDTVVVADPDAIRVVLAGDPETLRGGEANSFLRPVVGARSVSCLDGREHAARRRLVLPALQRGAAGLAADIRAITVRAMDELPLGRAIALQPVMRRITLAVALRVVLGRAEREQRAAIGAALAKLVDRGTVPLSQLGAIPALQRDLGPLSPWRAFRRDLDRLDAQVIAMIAARRARRGDTPAEGADALDVLLAARDASGAGLTNAELRDEVVTLVGAGYDTTATALAWAFERITAHPAALARVLGELASRDDRDETADLPYLDAVILETLRQRPVLPTFSRIARADVDLGGRTIRAGTRVMLCAWLAHHRADLYPEPERFLPERFLDRRSPQPFLPFGGGVRRCPGAAIALEELRVVVATVLSRFRVERARLAPSRPIFRGSTLAPADGARVVLHPRP